ncbi:hypothetical protein KY347_01465 [Candidatus Woesearchaeota archaeon]|nr:hypothetical protein [Candidatus Woesearchaeota archaeon]
MRTAIRFILLFVLMAAFSGNVLAATVYGNIYDLSLNKASGARVEVNTTPGQYFISKDGSYSFDIPNGFYTIKAEQRNDGVSASESRNITISREGNYVIDLILFPSFDEEDELSQDIGIAIPEAEEISFASLFVLIFLFFLGIAVYVIFKGKKEKNNKSSKIVSEDEEGGEKYLGKIIELLREEGGRTTQKEIRKHLPFSEAKISLMLSELEHKGLIKKIKKGRGNILVLKKK